jgi:hypothetical protein
MGMLLCIYDHYSFPFQQFITEKIEYTNPLLRNKKESSFQNNSHGISFGGFFCPIQKPVHILQAYVSSISDVS